MNKTARKCLSGLLAVCMLIGVMPVSLAASDIDGHWAQTALEHFIQQDWLKGYDGAYTPNATMTRAEYAALINRVGGLKAVSDKIGDYTDVPEGAWYHDDMAKALAAGYMNGVSASSMAPAGELTREQAFTMLARLLSCTAEETALDSFPDKADVADYAREAVAGLVKAGYVSGTGEGTLAPKAVITRAEGVTILYNALQAIQDLGKAEKGPYTDGVYTGTGAGYGGTVKVQMTVENGNITKIEVLSHKETYAYYNRASRLIDTVLEKQTTDGVDAVSGATGSSKGLLTAMGACVSQAKGGKDTSRTGRTGSSSGSSAGDKPEGDDYTESTLKDGVYEGKALGNGGNITVKVTVENGKIAKIEASYPFEDEEYFGSSDADLLTKRIIDNQSTKVDGISGATHSSDGLKTAVENALKGAETTQPTQPDKPEAQGYVLMNIPYAAFYEAAGATIGDVDAVASATNKTGNYGKAGGAFHSGKTAETAEDGTVTAVGGANGSQVKGAIWPVKIDENALTSLGGTEITDASKVTTATLGRGQSSSNELTGYQALTEAPAYSYYKLTSEPAYYFEAKVEDGKAVFTPSDKAEKKNAIEVPVSYGTNWGDVQLNLSNAADAQDKLLNALVLTAEDGTSVGLYHLDQMWSNSDIAWKVAAVSGLDGKTLTGARYYCSVKDTDLTDGTAPAYENYVYEYTLNTPISQVYTGKVTGAFEENTLVLTGLPADAQNVQVKVYHTTGGRGAVYTYITPLTVDPADDDIDPVFTALDGNKLTVEEGSVTNKAGTTQTYGALLDGTTYTVEFSCDNYIIRKITVDYKAEAPAETFVLMNIPYAEFYAAEGDDDVDAVTSSTLNKPRTGTLAGGSYHVNSDGTDISGVIYPVLVQDAAALEGLTEITDSSSVTISVTNRGQTAETTYEGKDALFEANDHAYYKLAEEPALYKTLTVEGDKFTFSAVNGEAKKVEGVTADVAVGGHHTDVEIKLTGAEGVDNSTVVSGVVLTDSEGAKYGLRHVYNIWRGTELGWNLGEYDLGGKTITNIRYITKDAVIDFPVEFTVGKAAYVLMNIPYAEFYAAEGDDDVDAVTSSTLNKPRTGTLAGGSYHVNSDGTDISGVTYPVFVSDLSALEGFTEITDDSSVTISVTNRGQTSETTYEGKDALFEAPDHAYYKLIEKPTRYKTLTAEGGAFTFSAVNGRASTVNDVTAEVGYGGHHTDVEIKLTGLENIDSSTVVSAVVLTLDDGAKLGLRHVYNIWRGTELGWNYDELDVGGRTITNIRYITKDAVIDFPVEIAVKPVLEGGLTAVLSGDTLTFAALPDDLGEATLTVTYTVGSGRTAKRATVFEGALAETVTLSEPVFDEPVEGEGVYSATVVCDNYADIAVTVNPAK